MGVLPGRDYIDTTMNAGNASASSGSIWLARDRVTKGQVQLVWDGTLEATVTFHGCNDPHARPDLTPEDTIWTDITDLMEEHADPAGTPGNNGFAVDNLNWDFIRIDAARTAGSGRLRVNFAGRSA